MEKFGNLGFWAHEIVPNRAGQQPFDIFAVSSFSLWMVDVKHVGSGGVFSLSNIEDNQWLAMERVYETRPLQSNVNDNEVVVFLGFIIVMGDENDESFWFLSYSSARYYFDKGNPSVKILDMRRIFNG